MTDNEMIKRLRKKEVNNVTADLIAYRMLALLENNTLQKQEIERLQGLLSEWKTEAYKLSDNIDGIKVEAIKEFWGKLKEQNTMDARIVSVASGDNLVKEMTGGATNDL